MPEKSQSPLITSQRRLPKFPPSSTLPTLFGRSNYTKWHSSMSSSLLSHPWANALIFGRWSEPSSRYSTRSTSSAWSSSKSSNAEVAVKPSPWPAQSTHEIANLETCRFIRSTLAMNVVPFVNGHTCARALWEQLVFLYGDQGGIDARGGSAIPSPKSLEGGGFNQLSSNLRYTTIKSSKGASRSSRTQTSSDRPKKVAFDFGFREEGSDNRAAIGLRKTTEPESAAIPVSFLMSTYTSFPAAPSSSLSSRRPSHPPPLHFDINQSHSGDRKASVKDGKAEWKNDLADREMKSLILGKDYETPGATPTPGDVRSGTSDYFGF